jgi:hypothetical protein
MKFTGNGSYRKTIILIKIRENKLHNYTLSENYGLKKILKPEGPSKKIIKKSMRNV